MNKDQQLKDMRHAIDQMELAMMGLGDFVDLPDLFDGAEDELTIAPRVTVGQVRRACIALAELTRIINSDDYHIERKTPARASAVSR